MRIGSLQNYNLYSFGNQTKTKQQQNSNPISQKGEKALLVKSTFVAGLALGARLLLELMDGDFVVDTLGKKAGKIVDKNHKNASKNKKFWLCMGTFVGLATMFVAGFAMLYTAFQAPKINYKGNVNAFKKGKDMDVYIKGNEVEKELLTQMNDKAKGADSEEKAKLKEQYMQMQMAKNRVPDFVKTKI